MMNGGVKYRWDSNQGDSLTYPPAVSVLFLWRTSDGRVNHAVQRAVPTLTAASRLQGGFPPHNDESLLRKHGIAIIVTFHLHDEMTAVFLGSGRFFALSAQSGAGLTGCTKAHFFSHCVAVHVFILFNGMLSENLYWFTLHLPIIVVN
jgi:hypothetical protein